MKCFDLHTHQISHQPGVLEVVNQYPQTLDVSVSFYSIGIHPWHLEKMKFEDDLKIIENTLKNPNCLAVGECGLDKRIETHLDLQIQIFTEQLLLAERYKKPVIVHCVSAFQEVVSIYKSLKISVPLLFHGFSKSPQLAQQLLENGFYISFGKELLRNPKLKNTFVSIPNDRFFLETDIWQDSIEDIYKQASTYKEISLETLQKIIELNFRTVFKNKK